MPVTARAIRIAFIVASEPFEQNATRCAFGTIFWNIFATSISSAVGLAKCRPKAIASWIALTCSLGAWPLISTP